MDLGRTTVLALVAALAVTTAAAGAIYALVPSTTPPTGVARVVEPSPAASTVEPNTLDAIPSGTLDPAALPERTIDRALLVVSTWDATPESMTLLGVDAATEEWVRVVVPGRSATTLDLGSTLALAPDGRSLLVSSWEEGAEFEIVSLATGAARPVSPQLTDEDCQADAAAWAPDGQHLGIVVSCATYTDPETLLSDLASWVIEVDMRTGAQRTLDHVIGYGPYETYPSYSPDGRYVAYGVWKEGDDEDASGGIRTVDTTTGRGHVWPDSHMTYGDPWQDARTLVGWDLLPDPGSGAEYTLIDAATETSAPLGMAGLFNLNGHVAGHLVIDRTPWVDGEIPCAVTYCLTDPDSRETSPWLETPGSVQLGFLSPARSLLR